MRTNGVQHHHHYDCQQVLIMSHLTSGGCLAASEWTGFCADETERTTWKKKLERWGKWMAGGADVAWMNANTNLIFIYMNVGRWLNWYLRCLNELKIEPSLFIRNMLVNVFVCRSFCEWQTFLINIKAIQIPQIHVTYFVKTAHTNYLAHAYHFINVHVKYNMSIGRAAHISCS